MKYIITGGCGFIGSHLAKSFIASGDTVFVIDDLSSGYMENIEDLLNNPGFQFFHAELLGFSGWESILDPGDIIIHLAATVGVNNVAVNALETLENNYGPTLLLLELARRHQCKIFFSSTSEIYGELDSHPFSESDPMVIPGTLCGRSAYVLGKIVSEQYCVEYGRQKGVPIIISRFFNVVGINQSNRFGMVVPTFIQQALNNEPITLYGDGSQTRSFCNVEDLVSAVRLLLDCNDAWGQTFNIGHADVITIKQLALYIMGQINSQSRLFYIPFPQNRSNGRDIQHRAPCLKKIRTYVQWEPRISWQLSVDNIIAERLIEAK